MKTRSGKRSKKKRKSVQGKCLSKSFKVEVDPESENICPLQNKCEGDLELEKIPLCKTPLQHENVRDDVRRILARTPSHLNITASADHGSPVSAPTISQTTVQGSITINQNLTVVLQNPSDFLDQSDVKEGTSDKYQVLPSYNTEQVIQKDTVFHRRRRLSFQCHPEQPTLTLAEVKKNRNCLVTVTGRILSKQPAVIILPSEGPIHYSHYMLCDTTASVHLSLGNTFNVALNEWYVFKSVSICDYGKGNVLCSTERTTIEPFTPLEESLQEPEEEVISGVVTEVLLTFEYICSCGATISLSHSKVFIKCDTCKKRCRSGNIQNRANASVTIKQPNGTDHKVVLNDALLRSVFSFKKEGFCDSQQLEERLLKAERLTVVCVDDEPQSVQIEAVEEAKHHAKSCFFRCCVL